MTSSSPALNDSAPATLPLLRPRAILFVVLLGITTLFVLTTVRASLPGYTASAQAHDDRPQTLPDR